MQRKTAKKEAWRSKCAAPRLVCDLCTLVRDIYARICTYDVRPSTFDGKKKHAPQVRSRDEHLEHVCSSLKNGMDIWAFMRKTCLFYEVAYNYLVVV